MNMNYYLLSIKNTITLNSVGPINVSKAIVRTCIETLPTESYNVKFRRQDNKKHGTKITDDKQDKSQ